MLVEAKEQIEKEDTKEKKEKDDNNDGDLVGEGEKSRKESQPLIVMDAIVEVIVGRQCWGKTILPRAGYRLGTYRTVDLFNFSHFS